MKDSKEPLVLSGRVFVAWLLASDSPDLSVPTALRVGDLKLVAVPSERAGLSRRSALQHYTGFFAGNVFDGRRWRKFNLRAGAAVEATYVSNGDRRSKLKAAIRQLSSLAGRTAVWGERGYETRVPPKEARPVKSSTAASAKAPSAAQKQSRHRRAETEEQLPLFD